MRTQLPIGVCTWTYGDLPLPEIAARLAALGFEGVELAGDLEAYRPSEVLSALRQHGLALFSLTPANVDLAHPDASVRQAALDYYLRLLDFAAALGEPLVAVHGYVGRVRALSSMAGERSLLVDAVHRLGAEAAARRLRLVVEVLNRYESHLVNNAAEALDFLAQVDQPNVGILLDAYHMNIEERDPAGALRLAGDRLWLYHVADSNRQGIGGGHTDFDAQMAALGALCYAGPIILEPTAPGPDPFRAIKDEGSREHLERYLRESRAWLRGTSDTGGRA